jgi:hypothetical protein
MDFVGPIRVPGVSAIISLMHRNEPLQLLEPVLTTMSCGGKRHRIVRCRWCQPPSAAKWWGLVVRLWAMYVVDTARKCLQRRSESRSTRPASLQANGYRMDVGALNSRGVHVADTCGRLENAMHTISENFNYTDTWRTSSADVRIGS